MRIALSILLVFFMAMPSFTHYAASDKELNNTVTDMISQVNETLVFNYHDALMSFGSRYTGSENCSNAADYIYNEFKKMGLWVQFDEWNYGGFHSRNVVATLNGTSDGNGIVIMSAHYDCTSGSLGADDDGSGVAAVLASAEIMSHYTFNHTVRFIAFSGEEVGTYGSFTYAKEAYERGDNIVAVINADMVGYADTAKGGRIMRVFETERTKWISSFSVNVSEKYMQPIDLSIQPVPNYRGADHQAFLDYGYDAVFYAHYDGYPWANSPEDTPDHINHTYQVKATKLLLAIVAEMANRHFDIEVMIKNPLEGEVYLFGYPLFPISGGKLWYSGLRGATIIIGDATASVDVISDKDIDYVIFCIDDEFVSWDRSPPYEWKIQGKYVPPMGRHRLVVYAYDSDGHIAKDEMDIIIFTLAYQYAPWH